MGHLKVRRTYLGASYSGQARGGNFDTWDQIKYNGARCAEPVPVLDRPIRLEAQDAALSRLKQGFESPMGHTMLPPLWSHWVNPCSRAYPITWDGSVSLLSDKR